MGFSARPSRASPRERRDFGGRNGARRRARALRARRDVPRRRRCRPRVSPRARHRTRRGGGGAEAGEAGGAVDVKPGAERAADAIVGALCALSGVDAGDETLADGSRAVGVAELAEATVAGLEAAFVGPGGSARTPRREARRRTAARGLAQTAALAEVCGRRRLRNRPRVDDARARAAARRGGYPPATPPRSPPSRPRRRRSTLGCDISSRTSRGSPTASRWRMLG